MSTADAIRTTCPRDCYDACGILVLRRDGAIDRVRGDPDHAVSRGKLCRKCTTGYNGSFLDPGLRITEPLRRVDRKGRARFEPVSWDDALSEIAGRLRAIGEPDGSRRDARGSGPRPGAGVLPRTRRPRHVLLRPERLGPADMGESSAVHGIEVTVTAAGVV